MVSPWYCLCLLVLHFTLSDAGPVGPLPNVTRMDLGLKEGSCALGDVVYLPGDEFPGASACERCVCANGQVRCEKQRCEPRPGCKAVHRPDHCCPTYQCECEQEGRVYGNGEKLVDPQDPCRVCYCQGGEVVCRRIACFVRDDCQPRLVHGRCCPEYDNCPLRGVTSVHGVTSVSTTLPPKVNTSAVLPHPGPIKPGFTIKEITPVSEIPVTDVKVKEILPSPNMDVDEYSSSKSPLIPREITSETTSIIDVNVKAKPPVNVDKSEQKTLNEENVQNRDNGDSTPSKISFSTQDSINSEIYPSNIPSLILMGPPSEPISLSPLSTKTPVIEEEDSSLFDHNPAFPPIPDDLSVLGNHEDEILPEQHFENDQIPGISDVMANDRIITDAPIIRESPTNIVYMTKGLTVTTDKLLGTDVSSEKNINKIEVTSTDPLTTKENPMINLRSVLPTQILNIPSFIADETTDDVDTTTDDSELQSSSEKDMERVNNDVQDRQSSSNETDSEFQTPLYRENIASDESPVISSTELSVDNQPSSILIETSDQNPHDGPDNISDSTLVSSTVSTLNVETVSDNMTTLSSMELGKESAFENIETTEFIFTSFGSQESATEAVELIKMSIDSDKSSALIKPSHEKNNVLTDLINLVGDVASISDHTDSPTKSVAGSTTISDSEELIPVNLGYKSKNNNWNLNSITEIPHKSKNMQPSKMKNMEIEDDDEIENITDSPPPNDKIEPTTKRPVIDNVSDGKQQNVNSTVKNEDSEMITKVYVPTVNKRPTKFVMGNSNEAISGSQLTDSSKATSVVSDEEKDSKHSVTTQSHQDVESTLAEEETTDQPLDDSLAQ